MLPGAILDKETHFIFRYKGDGKKAPINQLDWPDGTVDWVLEKSRQYVVDFRNWGVNPEPQINRNREPLAHDEWIVAGDGGIVRQQRVRVAVRQIAPEMRPFMFDAPVVIENVQMQAGAINNLNAEFVNGEWRVRVDNDPPGADIPGAIDELDNDF